MTGLEGNLADEAMGVNRSASFLFCDGESTFLGGNNEFDHLHWY